MPSSAEAGFIARFLLKWQGNRFCDPYVTEIPDEIPTICMHYGIPVESPDGLNEPEHEASNPIE